MMLPKVLPNVLPKMMAALAVLAIAACTSDELVVDEAAAVDSGISKVAAGGTGYLRVSIDLSSDPVGTTKATGESDGPFDFEDGSGDESDPEGLMGLIFFNDATGKGDEADFTYCGFYLVNNENEGGEIVDGNDDGDIETEVLFDYVMEITVPKGDIYALAFFSGEQLMTFEGVELDEVLGVPKIDYEGGTTINVGDTEVKYGDTFSQFNQATSATIGSRILMINAPLYKTSSAAGSSEPTGSFQTLVGPLNIYPSQSQALGATADKIYVERAVAKVTVTDSSQPEEGEDYPYVAGFTLDNTNEKMFPVRNVEGIETWKGYANMGAESAFPDDYYRFVGPNVVATGSELHRIYWAVDPNYDEPIEGEGLTSKAGSYYEETNITDHTGWATINDGSRTYTQVRYCFENTMDVDHMTQGNTTRAIIAVRKQADSYFTVGKNDERLSYSELQQFVYEKVMASCPDLVVAAANVYSQGEETFYQFIKSAFSFKDDAGSTFDDQGTHLSYDNVLVDFSPNLLVFGPAQFSDGGEAYAAFKTAVSDEILPAFNESNIIYYYQNGIALFPVLIQHFGDELTPWSKEAENIEGVNDYWYTANDHLGRYGVVRNTWYELDVKSITGPGYPLVPKIEEGVPDDEHETWIKTEINIKKWVTREQHLTL